MTTCRHFDREGLARAERGLPDPHVDGCADCQAARADYERVRGALAETGAALTPRAGWEARVFATIDRAPPQASRRGWWLAGGVVAMAAAAAVWWRLGRVPPPTPGSQLAELETRRGTEVVRGRGPAVGEGLSIKYRGDRAAIWLYRDDARLVACSRMELDTPNSRDATCMLTAGAVLIEIDHLTAATYHVVTVQTELRAPKTLDAALALLIRADVRYQDRELIVE